MSLGHQREGQDTVPVLSVRNLGKRYGQDWVVAGIDLEVAKGQFVSLLGASGCGKTTLLRMIAGILRPDSGDVFLSGERVTHLPPYERNLTMVFQDYALFPHLTVFDNVAFGLRMRKRKARPRDLAARVRETLDLVRLSGLEERYPAQLSGGQQQRVAMARCLTLDPSLLLMDEPLSNLDAKIREEMRVELKQIQQRTGVTTLYVTHDQEEALSLSDLVLVMAQGRVSQIGTPNDIYARPADLFVAEFVGSASFLRGTCREIRGEEALVVTEQGLSTHVRPAKTLQPGAAVQLLIRPENVRIVGPECAGPNHFPAVVTHVRYTGGLTHYRLDLSGHMLLATVQSVIGFPRHGVGDSIRVAWDPEAPHLL